MHTHIYEFDLEKQEITITISEKPTIDIIGWIFPCIFCSSNTYNISVISNTDGILKSFVCKYCKNKKVNSKYCYKYYYLQAKNIK